MAVRQDELIELDFIAGAVLHELSQQFLETEDETRLKDHVYSLLKNCALFQEPATLSSAIQIVEDNVKRAHLENEDEGVIADLQTLLDFLGQLEDLKETFNFNQ